MNHVAPPDSSRSPARVLIAGGGFAAVEAVLALRALAGTQVTVSVLAPEPVFHYRPAATSEAFDGTTSRRYDLRAIVSDLGAQFEQSRLEAVASKKRFVRTAAGARLHYDALIVATGARAVVGVPGAIMFRDQRDSRRITRLFDELGAGSVSRIVFAVPAGSVWPLPLYELALLSAKRARERGHGIDLAVVTPEQEPLEMFGAEASALVRSLLEERRVRFISGAVATGVQRDGSLALADRGKVPADRVVALPELRARRFTGVPAGRSGFVPVDASGRVEGIQDVYAAGDVTAFPIKQGGLAAQQADVVAQTIAETLGFPIRQIRAPRVLQARLLAGEQTQGAGALFLCTEFDWSGRPTRASLVRADDERDAKADKVLGRYLVPYLETREPLHDRPRAVA